MDIQKHIDNLNNPETDERLKSLTFLAKAIKEGEYKLPKPCDVFVNNHIHTTYSFSPYSPTKAVWMAVNAGLVTAGIMDHDSISGAREFIEAGKIMGLETTIGFETRVSIAKTKLNGKKLNNPDQDTVIYMGVHGIPHTQISKVEAFLKPYREKRIERDRKMVDNINNIISPYGFTLDFDKDVIPISLYAKGGTITERHILYALSKKIVEKYGKGQKCVDFIKNEMKLSVSPKIEAFLLDENNDVYEYDLLGVLKSDMVEKFFIKAGDECPDVQEAVDFAKEIGAISAYAYLGDVTASVTGDKKAQKFEDDILDEVFEMLHEVGYSAVTYMPSRNTDAQLTRLKNLCDEHGFMQISGEDINSPRQSFICKALEDPKFANLITATWALIGHEKEATKDLNNGIFSKETVNKYPDLKERLDIYAELGKK